ncbi:MAG: hypothetical protein C4532_02965 [Candidatus Abyssobacteria bacterium SURF_17]|jgi:diacylglycerol kinase family enzyme|uniref:diacylglycerol kinase (ATP) n=1 Tax=Candidatus Abyssobacteria bacterium SURF_17 TaxID=2093361 RepID=A0A419F722_9BACT|nr:MAG: hypothetical protein C4532_02965 [Candidatus Abyssubacteria bacterium SURF_17]
MNTPYLFLVNPFSGAGGGEKIASMLEKILPGRPVLREGIGEVVLINQIDDDRLRALLSRVEVVVVVGGDGTVSHLIPHILECLSPPAIGLIPLGTSNDLARTLGVSVDENYTDESTLKRAVEGLLNARETKLDILSVNDKLFFCNYFSIGLDAAIVRDFHRVRGSRWVKLLPAGRLTNNVLYFFMGLRNAGFCIEPPVEITFTGEDRERRITIESRCRAIIIGNLPFYAGGCPLCPQAQKDDGMFEITVVWSAYQYIMLIATRFLRFLRLPRGMSQYRARRATISMASRSPFQIDGEKGTDTGSLPSTLTFSVHASLRVLVP